MVDHVNGVESDRADRQQLRHSGQVWCVSVSLLKMIPIKRVPSVIISQPLSPRPSLLSSLFSQVRQSSLFQARLLQTRQSLRTPPPTRSVPVSHPAAPTPCNGFITENAFQRPNVLTAVPSSVT